MYVLLVFLLLSLTNQGLATSLRNTIRSLVDKKLTSPMAIIDRINEVDEYGRNALHYAVMFGDLRSVEFFLANDIDTRATDKDGLIPLSYAERLVAEQPTVERMQIVSLVLEITRGINKGDGQGWPPMVWSLMAGDYERVIDLRDRGADVFAGRFAHPRRGQLAGRHNAVWAAEHLEDDRAIKILIDGAPDRYFPVAVGNGYQKFVRAMIEKGIDVNVRDGYGYSAAMRAAKAGRIKDLQMLIDNGAQIDSKVLFLAIHSGNPKLVEMIVKQDVELVGKLIADLIHGRIYFPETFVGEALAGSKSKKKIHRMITKAISESTFRLPPLETVANLQQLKEGMEAHESYMNIEMPTLLQVAIMKGQLDDLRMLLDNGAQVDSTGLFFAIHYGNPEIVETILEHNIDVAHELVTAIIGGKKNISGISVLEVLKETAENRGEIHQMITRVWDKNIQQEDVSNKYTLGKDLLQAFKQKDTKTIQGYIDRDLNNNKLRDVFHKIANGNMELLDSLADRQLIDYHIHHQDYRGKNYHRGILSYAAQSRNLPIIDKVVSLGGIGGIDEALKYVASDTFWLAGSPPKSQQQLAEYEERQLAMMKSLIDGGADVNALTDDNTSPLTESIRSLQASRVELLLKHGAVEGDIYSALKNAEYVAHIWGKRESDQILEYQKNLTAIKKMLADNRKRI